MSINKTVFKDDPNSYWLASVSETGYPILEDDRSFDIAIVGGGIVGLTAAYLLSKANFKVAVIEADRILHGTTGHTTAKVTSQHSLIYAQLIKNVGHEKARQYAEANERAIDTIESIIRSKNIDCDFERLPAYMYAQTDLYRQDIEDEAEAAASLGIKASYVKEIGLPFPIKAAVRFDNQGQFHPLKYLQSLADLIIKQGSNIYEQTRAMNIEKDQKDEGYLVITHSGRKVKAAKVIIASHFPFFDGGGFYFARIYVSRSYILGAMLEEKIPAGMYISADQPIHSLRTQPSENGEITLIGGGNHKTGQQDNTNQNYINLQNWAKQTFKVKDIPYRWSAQDCMTVDGIPYVGHITSNSPDLFVATGFGKWGMTNGTAAAMIIKDLITNGESPWAPVYDPSRFPNLAQLVAQNADVAKQYITGKFKPANNMQSIDPGQAGVIDINDEKAGAYRDKEGNLHCLDITCTHMGCELAWNNAEKTWDCPCHGSRFSYDGDIVEGPALNHLKPIKEDRNSVEPNVFQ